MLGITTANIKRNIRGNVVHHKDPDVLHVPASDVVWTRSVGMRTEIPIAS